jgi:hypothetical protein
VSEPLEISWILHQLEVPGNYPQRGRDQSGYAVSIDVLQVWGLYGDGEFSARRYDVPASPRPPPCAFVAAR